MTCETHAHIAGDSEHIEIDIAVTDTTVDLTGAACEFLLYESTATTSVYSVAGDVSNSSGAWVATFDIPKGDTVAVTPGRYEWRVTVEGTSYKRTPATGVWKVLAKVDP